jgi:phenylacetate-coenzyme A ligase PaaK-like adenylate-forming protein
MSLPPIDQTQPYWDARLETLPPDRRRLLQEHRLHWQFRRCWDGSPFYRARFEAAGLEPATFGGLADWGRLPILRESDLPATADWAVAPQNWWVRQADSSGHPTRVDTDGDAIQQADLAARALWAAGARPGQTLDPKGSGISLMTRPQIAAGAARIGADLGGLNLEDFAPGVMWPVRAPLVYLCCTGEMAHWNDDHFLIEIVDPSTGEPVPAGATGAVVVTDLAREGSPLLRFLTRQIAAGIEDGCACGRTSSFSRTLG